MKCIAKWRICSGDRVLWLRRLGVCACLRLTLDHDCEKRVKDGLVHGLFLSRFVTTAGFRRIFWPDTRGLLPGWLPGSGRVYNAGHSCPCDPAKSGCAGFLFQSL